MRACPHRYFALHPLRRQREAAFVDELFARLVATFADAVVMRRDRLRAVVRVLGAASLRPAGYFPVRSPFRMSGEIDRSAGKVVDYLLGMPRIQQALDAKFDAAAFTMDRCAEIMAGIAMGTTRVREQALDKDGNVVELERDVSPADRLRAVDMRIRATAGYAPSRSVNANLHSGGRGYDPAKWEKTPPIDMVSQPPKNVTPHATRRGGKSKGR